MGHLKSVANKGVCHVKDDESMALHGVMIECNNVKHWAVHCVWCWKDEGMAVCRGVTRGLFDSFKG